MDARAAYAAYPGPTLSVTAAAVSVGAQPVCVSTGYLKALGEQVVRDLAPETGAICRIGGVMGRCLLAASMPCSQDIGFGYFVSALGHTLRA